MASVFLVDDHPDVREVVGQLLTMHGHTVRYIPTGELAIEQLQTEQPHVLITDHRLPGMSGVQLLQKIRHDPRFQDIRCILFSADSDTEQLAEEAGAHSYWIKGSDSLFDSIAHLEGTLKA